MDNSFFYPLLHIYKEQAKFLNSFPGGRHLRGTLSLSVGGHPAKKD